MIEPSVEPLRDAELRNCTDAQSAITRFLKNLNEGLTWYVQDGFSGVNTVERWINPCEEGCMRWGSPTRCRERIFKQDASLAQFVYVRTGLSLVTITRQMVETHCV
jgi:hypothetical protein